MNFTASVHCTSRAHCFACRNDTAFRASVFKAGMEAVQDFECPLGARIGQTEGLPNSKFDLPATLRVAMRAGIRNSKPGLGDVIEGMVKPIARALRLDCLDEQGKLKPQSGCAQRRDRLNKIRL